MPQTPHHLSLLGIHRENKGLFSQRLTLRHKRHATSLRKCRVCLVPMGARLLPICSMYTYLDVGDFVRTNIGKYSSTMSICGLWMCIVIVCYGWI